VSHNSEYEKIDGARGEASGMEQMEGRVDTTFGTSTTGAPWLDLKIMLRTVVTAPVRDPLGKYPDFVGTAWTEGTLHQTNEPSELTVSNGLCHTRVMEC
jgi:hypothetical protein